MSAYKSLLMSTLAAVVLVAGGTYPVEAEAARKARKQAAAAPSLVQVAVAANSGGAFAGQFDILLAAVGAADPVVATALSSKGQLTVFAPTDGAFEALLAELDISAEALLGSTGLLTEVLLYHVAPGHRSSTDVLGAERIRTLKNGFVYQAGGKLIDNNGRQVGFVVTDIPASNGVIHVIDTVLLP